MFIDTHAHLSYPEFSDDLPQLIARARASGVGRIISIATDIASAKRTLEIGRRFAGVSAAVGLHPNDVPHSSLCDMKELARLAADPKVVAIGETGLDYYREAKDDSALRQQQKDLLWAHLDLAKQLHKPVVIHNRSADVDLIEILRAHEPGFRPWGVMHCFAGTEQFANDCLEIGLLISLTGILTFKNATALRETARQIPLDRLMLETDAPYLAPVPYRGQRNEPSYVPLIAQTLAELKGVSVDEVAAVTNANADQLFRLSKTNP